LEPEFTVLIASHKRENMLGQALSYLEAQTIDHRTFEVIVVKDYEIQGDILDNRSFQIRVFDSDIPDLWKKHMIGVLNSAGKYICFLDDDDLFSRYKIERLSELLEKNNADFVVNSKAFFKDGETAEDITSVNNNAEDIYELRGKIPRDLFAKIPWYNCSSMTICTDIAKKHVGLIENITREIDPFWFLVGLEYASIILYDENKLTLYRRHQGGVSRSNDIVKLCNYSEKAIINLTRMNNIFSSANSKRLISYNTCEWNAKARSLGCVKSRKLILKSIFSLIPFIRDFSKKWTLALLALLMISFISVKIAQNVYPRIYQ
jgi:glycosyltransferase involved in cell wall biosynthesis